MIKINPYLNFNGNAEEAFNFYKSVFGGEFSGVQRFKDVPEGKGSMLRPEESEKIIHIALPIGETLLMASDVPEKMDKANFGNNFYISLQADNKEEAERIFNELSEGGKIEMPLADSFWNAYFGMFEDKFKVRWMISYNYPK